MAAKNRVDYTEFVGVRMNKEDVDLLKKIARYRRTHLPTLIREAVAEFLRRNPQKGKK